MLKKGLLQSCVLAVDIPKEVNFAIFHRHCGAVDNQDRNRIRQRMSGIRPRPHQSVFNTAQSARREITAVGDLTHRLEPPG